MNFFFVFLLRGQGEFACNSLLVVLDQRKIVFFGRREDASSRVYAL